jgi:hypothetical protein
MNAFSEFIAKKFGSEIWAKVLERVGLSRKHIFLPMEEVNDHLARNIVMNAAEIIGMSYKDLSREFGYYLATVFIPRKFDKLLRLSNSFRGLLMLIRFCHEAERTHSKFIVYDVKEIRDNVYFISFETHVFHPEIAVGKILGLAKLYNEEIEILRKGSNFITLKIIRG